MQLCEFPIVILVSPGRPNITVTDIEASSVIVRWTKPVYNGGSPVIQYKLVIDSKTFNITAPKTHQSVGGLTKDTEYEVKVYAKNVVGYGNASTAVFTTKKQGNVAFMMVAFVEFVLS